MREALAFFIIFFLLIVMFIATAENRVEGRFADTLCANITCYYETKENK